MADIRISNEELATVREGMREMPQLIEKLDGGSVEKVVLMQRNQMRAVLLSVDRYQQLISAAENAEVAKR